MGNPCVSHSITEAQIDDNYELLCRIWSPLVGAEEGGLSTPIARSTQRVKAIDGKSTPTAENEAIVFNGKPTSSPKDIANKFNKQFTTSKLGIHSSSHETRYVSREARKKSQETAPIFTTAMVTSAIKSCSNSRAFGPDLLSIFHLKLKSWRSENHTPHYYWLNQSK